MILTIDDEKLQGVNITQKQALLDLAIGLFIDYKATIGQAARIAELSQIDFQRELGKRKISIHYDIEDYKQDLQTIEKLNLK